MALEIHELLFRPLHCKGLRATVADKSIINVHIYGCPKGFTPMNIYTLKSLVGQPLVVPFLTCEIFKGVYSTSTSGRRYPNMFWMTLTFE